MSPLFAMADIESAYGALPVHRGLSLSVEAGGFACVLGGNASGKSTALRVALGLVRPLAGRVFFAGRDITDWPTERRVAAGMAAVPEGRRVFPQMSVRDNLLCGAFGAGAALRRRRLAAVLERFPRLAERLSQAAGTLSGGEQQLLALGRALMSDPVLLCVDEPTMGLSPRLAAETMAYLADLRAGGLAILMVEQNANLALAHADTGFVLRDGRIALSGPAAELRADPAVARAYLGLR